MKIRNGFVSNSSSSSFIIGLNEWPKNECQLGEMIFKNRKVISSYGDEEGITTGEASSIIFSDMLNVKKKKMTKNQVLEEICGGYFKGYPKSDYGINDPSWLVEEEFRKKFNKSIQEFHDTKDDEKKKWYDKWRKLLDEKWTEQRKKVDEAAKVYLETTVWPKLKNCKYIFTLSYSDNDGTAGASLEHGDTFQNVSHVIISHH